MRELSPVLARELSAFVRTWRAPLFIVLYAGMVGAAALLFLDTVIARQVAQSGGFGPRLGVNVYSFLATAQLLLAVFAAPGLGAGGIASEHEQGTLEGLLSTRVTPFALVRGKLLSALFFVVILLLAALPAYSLVFLFGGISLPAFLISGALTLVTALAFAAIGLFFSALLKQTQSAIVATYAVVLLLVAGTFVTASLLGGVGQSGEMKPWANPLLWLACLNPVVALGAATGGPFFAPLMTAVLGPVSRVAGPPSRTTSQIPSGPAPVTSTQPAPAAAPSGQPAPPVAEPVPVIWETYLIVMASLFVILLIATVLMVRPVAGRGFWGWLGLGWRSRRKVAA